MQLHIFALSISVFVRVDSGPAEVFAFGDLEFYGENGPFRGDKCRTCPHKSECKFYWDITTNKRLMDLYVNNEKYDGYIS